MPSKDVSTDTKDNTVQHESDTITPGEGGVHPDVPSEDIHTSDPTEAERRRTDSTPTPVNPGAKQAVEGPAEKLSEDDYYEPAETPADGYARVHAEQAVPKSQPTNHGSPF